MNPINIVLVDDHQVLRRGLALLLGTQENFNIVADVSKGQEALEIAATQEVDLVITDLSMPEMSGIELTEKFTNQFPDIPVIVLSMHLDEQHVIAAIEAGAKGYLVKDASEAKIIDAVEMVAGGSMYLTPKVSDILTRSMLQQKKQQEIKETFHLTDREKEILQCIVDGLSNKMIAGNLSISERTVNAHRYNIMRKLDAHNTADVVRISLNQNLLV